MSIDDSIIEDGVRESWWEQGEAVMREMCDEDSFRCAEKVNSNSQLYKQAGNSIVVNVLESILKNLLLSDKES